MGSAQLDTPAIDPVDVDSAAPALRQQAAERLAAHRLRRARHAEAEAARQAAIRLAAHEAVRPARRYQAAAAAVLERFAQTPSYRAVLAAEARRAVEEAAAAAAVAARNAEAVAAAHTELLAELHRFEAPVVFNAETAIVLGEPFAGHGGAEPAAAEAHAEAPAGTPAGEIVAAEAPAAGATQLAGPTQPGAPKPGAPKPGAPKPAAPKPGAPVRATSTAAGLTVRLYEDSGRTRAPLVTPGNRNRTHAAAAPLAHELDAAETLALSALLDEEILFRKAPVFEEYAPHEPAVPLPANLLEFPRQLVAPKKARPRLAEGPLREDLVSDFADDLVFDPHAFDHAPHPQLRIFEVAATQSAGAAEPAPMPTFWTDSIWLDAHTHAEPVATPDFPMPPVLASLLPPQVAPFHLRAMSAAVDLLLVASGFVAFVAAAGHFGGAALLASGPATLAGGAVAVLAVLYFLYQTLFFTLTEATPGMRYARIGLCTFSDENPSRSAMRRRILAQAVAVCPLGLGMLWMLLDDDRLGWHDRISRMYQRAY